MICLASLILVLNSCENYNSEPIKIELEARDGDLLLEQVYSVINPNQDNRYSHKQVLGDTILVGFNPFRRNDKIDFVHLINPEKSFSLNLTSDQFSVYPSSFFVHSLDSIFLLNSGIKTVTITNIKGELKSKISLDRPELYNYEFLEFLPLKPIWHKGKIILNVRPIGLLEDGSFLREPQFLSFNPQNSEAVLFGPMKDIADYLGSGEVNTDFYSPYYEVVDDFLYVLYPFYPFIFKIDLSTSDFEMEMFKLGSSLVDYTTPPTTAKIHSDQFMNSSYRSSSVTFSDLKYHKESRLFSVLMMHPFQSVDENGRIKPWNTRRSSLLLLDEKLEIISEYKFEEGRLLLNSSIPFSYGLRTAISLENETIEDSLHYYLHLDFNSLLQQRNQ